jgi:hypothetical protein
MVDGDASVLRLPVAHRPSTEEVPAGLRFVDPPAEPTDVSDIAWRVADDVLARVTTAEVDHGSTYGIAGPGSCTDRYAGAVTVDRRTWQQTAESRAHFEIAWPEATVRASTTVRFTADATGFTLAVTLEASEGDRIVAARSWKRSLPRRLA